jgi:hypothetical protein
METHLQIHTGPAQNKVTFRKGMCRKICAHRCHSVTAMTTMRTMTRQQQQQQLVCKNIWNSMPFICCSPVLNCYIHLYDHVTSTLLYEDESLLEWPEIPQFITEIPV